MKEIPSEIQQIQMQFYQKLIWKLSIVIWHTYLESSISSQ